MHVGPGQNDDAQGHQIAFSTLSSGTSWFKIKKNWWKINENYVWSIFRYLKNLESKPHLARLQSVPGNISTISVSAWASFAHELVHSVHLVGHNLQISFHESSNTWGSLVTTTKQRWWRLQRTRTSVVKKVPSHQSFIGSINLRITSMAANDRKRVYKISDETKNWKQSRCYPQ